jgi:hypothetical protein
MTLQEERPQTERKMLSTYIRGQLPVTQNGVVIGLFDPWIRNPGWKNPDPGSRINMPDQQHW